MKYNRLTENDIHFGPLDIGERSKTWRPLELVLSSGCDEYAGCALEFGAFGWICRLRLPNVLKPCRIWVDTSRYEWSSNPAGGYWDIHRREFGFRLTDGFLQVFLGPQTHDSLTTKSWCYHLPWTEWHHHSLSYYGLEGELLREWIDPRRRVPGIAHKAFDEQREFEATMPKAHFLIEDYDRKQIKASTHINQREWTFGTKWCQWLRFFRKNKVHRSLSIEFDTEVGPEKGSWKGGMMGTGIEMLPGELHEAAFRRFCEQSHRSKFQSYQIKFLRSLP